MLVGVVAREVALTDFEGNEYTAASDGKFRSFLRDGKDEEKTRTLLEIRLRFVLFSFPFSLVDFREGRNLLGSERGLGTVRSII